MGIETIPFGSIVIETFLGSIDTETDSEVLTQTGELGIIVVICKRRSVFFQASVAGSFVEHLAHTVRGMWTASTSASDRQSGGEWHVVLHLDFKRRRTEMTRKRGSTFDDGKLERVSHSRRNLHAVQKSKSASRTNSFRHLKSMYM